jgi:hypothetical protein
MSEKVGKLDRLHGGGVGRSTGVTHIGGGPWTFVTTQPGRNIGGITLSKLSSNSTGLQHGGHCGGLEATTGAEISDGPKPSFAREELITPVASAATVVTTIASVVGPLMASLISLTVVWSTKRSPASNEN